jgi:flagellar basal-body rod protein FlgB
MAETNGVVELLEAGLKASGLRSKVIANNIANLNTPGYRRQEVRFETLLAKALESPSGANIRKVKPEIFEPRSTPVSGNGNDVNLDAEVGEMIKNGAAYKAYVRLLNRVYKQMELAIDGRV